jgi:hypothetical protein
MVATEAGTHPNVSALVYVYVAYVYVAARAPDAGKDYAALVARFPAAPAAAGIVKADGFLRLSEMAFLNDFANGVEAVKAHELYAVQQPNAATLPLTARTTAAAWRSKPSWYAISKQDRTINSVLDLWRRE